MHEKNSLTLKAFSEWHSKLKVSATLGVSPSTHLVSFRQMVNGILPLLCSALLPVTLFSFECLRVLSGGSALCRLQATLLVIPRCDPRCPVDMMGCKSVEETDVNRAQCAHVAAWREIHGLIHPARICSWEMRSAGVTGGLTHVAILPTACKIRNTFWFMGNWELQWSNTSTSWRVLLRPGKNTIM